MVRRFLRILPAVVAASLAVAAAPAQAVSGGEFSVPCSYDHMLPDDPIVFPGGAGMSHSHDFGGNRTTNAFTTTASLLAGTSTCTRGADRSGYWVPTLLKSGVPVHPREFRAYYRGSGFDGKVVR